MANVLALDIATKMGFAEGDGSRPLFGQVRLKLPEDSPDRAVGNIACWLRDRLRLALPDIIVIEAPLNPVASLARGNSYGTSSMAFELVGAVKGIARCYGVRVRQIHVQSVRKAFVGHGRPASGKQAVIDHCRALGIEVTTDNEADAVALWFVQQGYIFGELPLAHDVVTA